MKKKLFLILFIFLFSVDNVYSQNNKQKTEVGVIIEDGVEIGKKVVNWLVDKFPRKHKTPINYIPVSEIQQITRDSFKNIEIIKQINPELELKVLYPRITPKKGFVSFQLGDFKYFRYLKDVSIDDSQFFILI